MATFVVCTHCGKTVEIAGRDQLPAEWKRTAEGLRCSQCLLESAALGDVLEEEVIYPTTTELEFDDTFGGDFCEICAGDCRGH